MGREIHRVPLDFNWPLNKPWKGYLNPHYIHCHNCPDCENGYSEYGKYLNDLWYGYVHFNPEDNDSIPCTPESPAIDAFARRQIERSPEYYGTGEMAIYREALRLCDLFNNQWSHHLNQDDVNALVEAGRLWDFVRRPLRPVTENDIQTHAYYLWIEAGCPESDGVEFWNKSVEEHSHYWLPYDNGYIPTAQEINDWSIGGFGHDSINASIVCNARAEREGKSIACSTCGGSGSYWESPENEKQADEWEREDPPKGEGYQCWETVSEGSPISPVFAVPEELADYMVRNPWGADKNTTFEEWCKFIRGPGWSPSFVIDSSGIRSGVSSVVEQND